MSIETINNADVLDPKDPLDTAKRLLANYQTDDGIAKLVCWDRRFLHWDNPSHRELEQNAMIRMAYKFLETKYKKIKVGDTEGVVDFKPTKKNVDELLHALAAEAHLPLKFSPPCWLDYPATDRPKPSELLVCRNGLVNLPRLIENPDGEDYLIKPTPMFFNLNALDYDFNRNAPRPTNFLAFLDSIAPEPDKQRALQQFAGYCLTADTSQQKALLMYGPPRSGKGTYARVMTALLGRHNVAGPTLGGLATNFGLWPLIDKSLAIISDARLSSRTDQSIITERILSITGEDALTIDRKNMAPVTMQLKTRLMILTNELPKLTDASGALARRFLIIRLNESFYGREDLGLTDRLLQELPGILLWAIEGWADLRKQGHFTVPESSVEAMEELDELASPIKAFVTDCCKVEPGRTVYVDELYEAWKKWCELQGRDNPGTKQSFGRDLGAAVPGIKVTQPRTAYGRIRCYEGVGLEVTP